MKLLPLLPVALSTAAVFLTTAAFSTMPLHAKAGVCVLKQGDRTQWAKCLNQRVQIQGLRPKTVASHVQRTPPIPGVPPMHQSYLDAMGYQFVLLSRQPIQCPNRLAVEGVLKRFSLGPNPAQPNMPQGYSNYDIQVEKATCLKP
jgi:hypothetical protein